MRAALKEWAIVVDALGHGDQILVLRKGGLDEEGGEFQLEHPQFLLFPTQYHQQREMVISSAQARFDRLSSQWGGLEVVRLEWHAEVVSSLRVESLDQVRRLAGQHVWTDEAIARRFHSGPGHDVWAVALRVFRLRTPVELPLGPDYLGCRSWVEVATDVSTEAATPVLPSDAFTRKLHQFQSAFHPAKAMPATHATL